jgi:hypothetical protein
VPFRSLQVLEQQQLADLRLLITGVHFKDNWNHLFHRHRTIVPNVKIGYNQYNLYAAAVRCNADCDMVVFSVVNPRGCSLCTGDSQLQPDRSANSGHPMQPTCHSSAAAKPQVFWYVNVYRNNRTNLHRRCRGPAWLSRYKESLRDEPSGVQIPVRAKFSVPVQIGPRTHKASYTMGSGSFPGVKRPGRGVNHPPPSIAAVTVELYLYSPSVPSWHVTW